MCAVKTKNHYKMKTMVTNSFSRQFATPPQPEPDLWTKSHFPVNTPHPQPPKLKFKYYSYAVFIVIFRYCDGRAIGLMVLFLDKYFTGFSLN